MGSPRTGGEKGEHRCDSSFWVAAGRPIASNPQIVTFFFVDMTLILVVFCDTGTTSMDPTCEGATTFFCAYG